MCLRVCIDTCVFLPGETTKEYFPCQPSSPGMDLQVLDTSPKLLFFLVSSTLEHRAVFPSPPIFHQFLRYALALY